MPSFVKEVKNVLIYFRKCVIYYIDYVAKTM